jgi:hypothetical protein
MERYLLQFMFVMVAFSGGGLLVNAWLNELSNKKIEIVPPPFIEVESKQTFNCGCGDMVAAISSDDISGGTCQGSDGSQIFLGSYVRTWNKDSANRTFARVIKAALKVVSIAPIFDDQGTEIGKRALIKNKESVKIIKLLKADEEQSYTPYVVSLIEAADFKHALAYENQKKEISRNVIPADF